MSIRLPSVDLSTASVGTSGLVHLPEPKVQVGELAHLRLYNESGCGVSIAFSNGHTEAIPAGAWPMFEIEPEVQTYTWTVTYVLPNAAVAILEGVYYFPNEGVPPTPALGNSPIGITGGVTTSSVQTLSNEGNASNTLVIDMGDTGNANLFTLYTDGHSIWKVDQSGVLHQVMKVQVSGNPLQLGQAGDITEVLGQLIVDQAVTLAATSLLTHVLGTLKVDGHIGNNTNPNATIMQTVGIDADTTKGIVMFRHSNTQSANLLELQDELFNVLVAFSAAGILTLGQINGPSAANLILNAVTGQNVTIQVNGSEVFHVDGGGLAFSSKKLFDSSANNLADWSAAGLFLKGNPANQGKFQYQADGTNSDFTISAISKFSGVGNGTFAHGLKVAGAGVTPDIVIPVQNVAGSQTFGYSALGATNVTITTGAGNAWVALAIKL